MPHTAPLRRYADLDDKTFLVCIGAAKCGTSWLHHYLGTMPQVAVSPIKELHFFNARFPAGALGDVEALAMSRLAFHLEQPGDKTRNLRQRPTFQASLDRAQMIYDNDAYFAHFARLCTPDTRTFTDITPAYSTLGPAGFAYLRDFAASQGSRLRILFIMREPVARYWSQLRHLQQMNPANDIETTWPDALTSPALNARADYRGIVSALDDTFPPEDILCLFYESLFEDETLQQLCTFAGVPFRPGAGIEAKNVTTVKFPMPEAARDALIRQLSPQIDFCRSRFGTAVPAAWQE